MRMERRSELEHGSLTPLPHLAQRGSISASSSTISGSKYASPIITYWLRFAFHPMKICKLVKNDVRSYPANAMSPILSWIVPLWYFVVLEN
jgi:hypothetical protein